MPIIRVPDANKAMKMVDANVNRSNDIVSSSFDEFAKQVNALVAMAGAQNMTAEQITTASSDPASLMAASQSPEALAIANVIETADLPENAGNTFWEGKKAEALGMQVTIVERLAKYVAALPQVQALRDT